MTIDIFHPAGDLPITGMHAIDSSGNGHLGTYTGDNFGSGDVQGRITGLVSDDFCIDPRNQDDLTGYSGYVALPASALSFPGEYAVEAWIMSPFPPTFSFLFIMHNVNISLVEIDVNTDGTVTSRRGTSLGFDQTLATPAGAVPFDGIGHHIVVTHEITSPVVFQITKIYVDAIERASTLNGVTNRNLPSLSCAIGSVLNTTGPAHAPWCDLILDEFALYSHNLTPERVSAHYEARGNFDDYTAEVMADGPSSYYHLNETNGIAWNARVGEITQRVVKISEIVPIAMPLIAVTAG